jgi:hypothetical protein
MSEENFRQKGFEVAHAIFLKLKGDVGDVVM